VNGTTAAGNTSQPAGTGGAAAPTAELTFPGGPAAHMYTCACF
jgi:hypothetical protein